MAEKKELLLLISRETERLTWIKKNHGDADKREITKKIKILSMATSKIKGEK